jgi:hypothetical protein
MAYAIPLLKDLADIIGKDVLMDALQQRLAARVEAARTAGNGPQAPKPAGILAGFEDFGENTLDYEVIASDASEVRVNVHQCGYARLAAELGGADIASILVCGEDYALAAYAGTQLTRTQTKMQGGEHCNFCFTPGTRG